MKIPKSTKWFRANKKRELNNQKLRRRRYKKDPNHYERIKKRQRERAAKRMQNPRYHQKTISRQNRWAQRNPDRCSQNTNRSVFAKLYRELLKEPLTTKELLNKNQYDAAIQKFINWVNKNKNTAVRQLVNKTGIPNDSRLIEGKSGKDGYKKEQFIRAALEPILCERFFTVSDRIKKKNGRLYRNVWDWMRSYFDISITEKAKKRWDKYERFVGEL